MQKNEKKKVSKDTANSFWFMAVALVLGAVFSANILFAAITLVALEGYSNYAFWQTVIGACGLILTLTFLFDGTRRYVRLKKNE